MIVGDVRVDVDGHVASVGSEPLDLTPKEFALLALLARNAGKVLTHRRVLDVVWGPGQSLDTLRTHVSHLRRKLGDAGSSVSVASEPGVGYRLRPHARSAKGIRLDLIIQTTWRRNDVFLGSAQRQKDAGRLRPHGRPG